MLQNSVSDKILFVSEEEWIRLKQNNTTQKIIVENIKNTDDILHAFIYQTDCGYMNDNWNSLDEVLVDCDWMDKDVVMILNHDLSFIESGSLDIYLSVLVSAVEKQRIGPVQYQILPQRKIDFYVVFLDQKNELTRWIKQRITEHTKIESEFLRKLSSESTLLK